MKTADPATIARDFVEMVGLRAWRARMDELRAATRSGQRGARAMAQRHVPEATIERLRCVCGERGATAFGPVDCAVGRHLGELLAAYDDLPVSGRARMREAVRAPLRADGSLAGMLHLARVAGMQRERGFEVVYAGLAEGAPFDLLVSRQGTEAEIVCDVASAEEGRDVHRGAWVRLVDRVDPDLQTWLAAHPGRYLLKMTLPRGLRAKAEEAGRDTLAELHERIRGLLSTSRRADHDEAAVLRLDPLMLAGSQADELGLMGRLRREFGHEAHLAVTASSGSVFVMAARAGREDEVAVAIRRRLAALAPARLTGMRPGIIAVLVEDIDRVEWQLLRERLEIEGEARQFLTYPEARGVVAVTCCSRLELLGDTGPCAAPGGELRFRNPSHPAAKSVGLAPAIVSSS